MLWNWQLQNWPEFSFDPALLKSREDAFLMESGKLFGAMTHIASEDHLELSVELISSEAQKSAEIEGEILNRASLQSSIRRNLGLAHDSVVKVPPAEQGMAEMLLHLYHHFDQPLEHETLFIWHQQLMAGRRDIPDIGCYRISTEPMQVISGYVHAPKVHFKAPPSTRLSQEMDDFIRWFNATAPNGEMPMPALSRAAIIHLWFVSIHPFEDGNGRIGRALSEKALSQSLRQPSLIALSQAMEQRKSDYYAALKQHNHTLQIDAWQSYFANTVGEAIAITNSLITFLIGKAKLYQRLDKQMNERQKKVIARLFKAGPEGFKGGLSAENYIAITRTSRATATRDLKCLVDMEALTRIGKLKSTRYRLSL